ncbi:unnamed protein product [Nippostrongylus brasiliensis]|uniref:Uncharacterized protein n=1 Tax=Nippostrongylus brasiliensis TaxID=27835 RepID=A0A0N4YQZ1_NIPBR|nr:unnamed protein product [Nippostrongylus brasiliensis]
MATDQPAGQGNFTSAGILLLVYEHQSPGGLSERLGRREPQSEFFERPRESVDDHTFPFPNVSSEPKGD